MKNIVLYDGRCGFCIKWMKRVRRMDFTKRLKWVNSFDPKATKHIRRLPKLRDLQKDIHFIKDDTAQGKTKIYKGFEAWRAILRTIPISWLFALLLYLPPFNKLGQKFYRHIADNRYTSR